MVMPARQPLCLFLATRFKLFLLWNGTTASNSEHDARKGCSLESLNRLQSCCNQCVSWRPVMVWDVRHYLPKIPWLCRQDSHFACSLRPVSSFSCSETVLQQATASMMQERDVLWNHWTGCRTVVLNVLPWADNWLRYLKFYCLYQNWFQKNDTWRSISLRLLCSIGGNPFHFSVRPC